MSSDKEDKPSNIEPVGATGSQGYGRTSVRRGQVWEEFHPHLRGKNALRIFREMDDNSPVLGAAHLIMESYITQAPWKVNEAKDSGPEGELYRDKIESMFDDMHTTRIGWLSDVISMIWAGHSYFETTYKLRRGPAAPEWMRSKHNDGLYGLADIEIRAQETIDSWKWDTGGRVVGAYQMAPPMGRLAYLPLDGTSEDGAPVQCVNFRTRNARGNPEGRSLYRNAYLPYWRWKRIEDFEGIGIERDMAGVLVQRVPPHLLSSGTAADNAAVERLRKFGERARRNEYESLVVASSEDRDGKTGYDTGLMQSGGRRPIDQDTVIKRLESRMALALCAEGVLLGSADTGSWALADSKTHTLAMVTSSVMRSIEGTINAVIIPRIMDANCWPIEVAPAVSFGDLENEDMVKLGGALSGLISSGATSAGPELDRWVRDRIGIPHESDVSPGELQERSQEVLAGEAATPEPQELVDDGMDEPQEAAAEAAIERGLSAEEAAKIAGVSPSVINAAIRRGQIPGAKVGRSNRVMSTDLREYMRGGRRG